MLRIGIKRIVWLSQMKQSVYHSAWNFFIFVLGKNFCRNFFIQKFFLNLWYNTVQLFFFKLFISYYRLKNQFTFPHIDFTLFDTIANNERFQYYQKDDRHLCMRPIEVSSVAKNAGDVGNLIFRECWGI